jgi:hypothetical protein
MFLAEERARPPNLSSIAVIKQAVARARFEQLERDIPAAEKIPRHGTRAKAVSVAALSSVHGNL